VLSGTRLLRATVWSARGRCKTPAQGAGATLLRLIPNARGTTARGPIAPRGDETMSTPHDLLQPSLQGTGPARAPYSQAAGFCCAFIGGPLATLLMAGLNARRLGRWPADLRWLLPAALLWLGFEWWLLRSTSGAQAVDWISSWLGGGAPELMRRALALACFAATALLLHRREHRMADLMGLDRPNGWWAGAALIVAGNLAHYVVSRLLA